MNILTTMWSNASLRRLRSCKKKVKSCPLQHRFNPSASFASESILHARSHRSCELATWCPRPFSLMSSCLSRAFLFFGDSIFWRGFHTLVLGSPRRNQDCAKGRCHFRERRPCGSQVHMPTALKMFQRRTGQVVTHVVSLPSARTAVKRTIQASVANAPSTGFLWHPLCLIGFRFCNLLRTLNT